MTQHSRAYAVRSNSAQEIIPEMVPWHYTTPYPKFPNKEEFREWCKKPTTDYCFFAMVEGQVSSLRLGNGNEPFRIHGIVADYDVKNLTPDEFTRGIARIPAGFPARAHNRTFSGGARVVWVFERPVFYYSKEVYEKFIRRCIKELNLDGLFPKLDEHIFMPELYYAAGSDWTVNEQATIPEARVAMWVFDACKAEKFENGIEVPLDVVEAEVHKKFPNRWKGDFVDGARGVRFWDPTGDAISAIVRPTGMVAFTGNEPFMPWDRIFGREFVQKYLEDRRGRALAEMHSDGTAYYRQLPDNTWDAMPTETARRHLRVEYGLTDKTPKGDNASEIDMVLNHLERRKRIAGAMPFPLNPDPIVSWNGMTFLNNSTAKLCAIHPEPQEWGTSFPWISQYLSTLFLDEKNLIAFLCWLHVWVKSAAKGRPCRGQALFLVGPPGTGKSLLSRQLLARIFGGYADARAHMVESSKYNDAMFQKALWVIDDSTVLADKKAHDRFSSLVKASVANDSMAYAQKYGYEGAVPFSGRVVVTLNDDPISLQVLPDTDQSLTDKIFLCKTGDTKADVAETEEERYAIIDREIPFFARWLMDFEMPDWMEKDSRFGVVAWHDQEVLQEARSTTVSSTVLEIVETWRKNFTPTGTWPLEITPTELYQYLVGGYADLMRGITLIGLSRHVNQAIANGSCPWMRQVRKGKNRDKYFVIEKK